VLSVVSCFARQQSNIAVVQRGTVLKFTNLELLNAETARVGDRIPLRLTRPLVMNGLTLLAEGQVFYGKVIKVRAPDKKYPNGRMKWKLDRVIFADGSAAKTYVAFSSLSADAKVPETTSDVKESKLGTALLWVAFVALIPFDFPALGEGGDSPGWGGDETFLFPGSVIAVVVQQNHHVRY
jgi:hypothetical protein